MSDGSGGGGAAITITMADSAKASRWSDRRTMGWDAMAREVLDPRGAVSRVGKDGPCFMPGVLTGERRVAAEVASIGVLVADIDIGVSAEEVRAVLARSGVAWSITSTWSHGRDEIKVKRPAALWTAMVRSFGSPMEAGRVWLAAHYTDRVAGSLVRVWPNTQGTVTELVFYLAAPVSRLRVVMPAAVAWTPAGGPGRGAAEQWRALYGAAWDALGLGWAIDRSCDDLPRLFYTGRMPGRAGTPPVFMLSDAGLPWARLEVLAGMAPPLGAGGDVAARRRVAMGRLEALMLPAGSAVGRRRTRHGGARGPGVTWQPWVVQRPGGGLGVDLEEWHLENAHELMVADLVAEHRPDMLDDRGDVDGKVHVTCPRGALHSGDDGGGTFVRNGSGWMPAGDAGRSRGHVFCNHNSCRDVTHGRWLGHLLAEGMVTWADLDAAVGRVEAARGAAARRDLAGDSDDPEAAAKRRRWEEEDALEDKRRAKVLAAGIAAAKGNAPVDGDKGDGDGDGGVWAEVIEAGRKNAEREEDAAASAKQFPATQRYMLTPGGRFFDLWAGGAEGREPQALAFTVAILAGQYGFSARIGDTLARWAEWDKSRRDVRMPPCIAAGVAYVPGGRSRVPSTMPGAVLVNLWRPGPVAWHEKVPMDEPLVAAFMALTENLSGDYREQAILVWWLADALARPGQARVTWGPVLFGPQGAGKSTYAAICGAVVGQHNASVVTFKEFMRSVENTCLVKQITVVEEATSGGTQKDGRSRANALYDALQPFYTATWLRLSQKYMTGQDIALFGRILVLTNAADAAAPPHDDRRMANIRARGGRLPTALADTLNALLDDPVQVSKLVRWLIDEWEVLGAVHGFSPFRCPTEDVASEFKDELIQDGLTQAGDVARAAVAGFEQAGRTVLTYSEVVEAVRARLRMEPGMRPSQQQVVEGITVGGWGYAARWAEGGRGGVQIRFYLRISEIQEAGLGNLSGAKLALRWRVETADRAGMG